MLVIFSFEGSGQGFGGFVLDEPKKQEDGTTRRVGSAAGMDYIIRLMDAFGARNFDDIKGRTAIAIRDRDGFGGTIVGVRCPTVFGGSGKAFLIDEWRKEWFATPNP